MVKSHYKICVLGDGGVGKTALTIQLCSSHFVEEYDPTIEDSYRKQVVIDNESCLLEILDTAGQEEFTALRDQWIRDCEGFIIVYSITSTRSFQQIPIFKQQILRAKDISDIPITVAGNKCDLEDKREVLKEEAQSYCDINMFKFKETSAKSCVNVNELFYDLVRLIRIFYNPIEKKSIRRRSNCVMI